MIKIYNYNDISLQEIFIREQEEMDVSDVVSDIIKEVKNSGDKALREYAKRFDNCDLQCLEVTKEQIEEAYNSLDKELIEIIEQSAKNIWDYHLNQKKQDFIFTPREGVILGQKVIPMDKVGIYVPGGTATYPSSVLMNALPAKIAGVGEIIMVTPAKDNKLNPVVLAAAKIAGVDRIFAVGGAQAVAALAYGTDTIPKVDKIVGPGNAYVAEAKKQVYGRVSIDMIAGPSEILVIADEKSDPRVVACDMLSQAEHDTMASAVLVTTSKELAENVSKELEIQIPQLLRKYIARASIDNYGKIILVDTIAQAIEVSNEIAPEHLEVSVDNSFDYLSQIKHAGSIFLGRYAPEALGDYYAGPNHTLPTSGTAKFSSPLSVDDFVKKSAFTYYTKEALEKECHKIKRFADEEGLEAHGLSAVIRFD